MGRRVLSSRGFSLVELMATVAIVGVLTMIAIPQYNKYQAKSLQNEAKIGLTLLYSSLKTFFPTQNSYTACLSKIGYVPPVKVGYYTMGFKNDVAQANKCGPEGFNLSCLNFNWLSALQSPCESAGDGLTYFRAKVDMCKDCVSGGTPTPPDDGMLVNTYIDRNFFTARAIGGISAQAVRYDIWTIDQDQVLSNDQGPF